MTPYTNTNAADKGHKNREGDRTFLLGFALRTEANEDDLETNSWMAFCTLEKGHMALMVEYQHFVEKFKRLFLECHFAMNP